LNQDGIYAEWASPEERRKTMRLVKPQLKSNGEQRDADLITFTLGKGRDGNKHHNKPLSRVIDQTSCACSKLAERRRGMKRFLAQFCLV
jgi:hypothetical protein